MSRFVTLCAVAATSGVAGQGWLMATVPALAQGDPVLSEQTLISLGLAITLLSITAGATWKARGMWEDIKRVRQSQRSKIEELEDRLESLARGLETRISELGSLIEKRK